MAKANAAQYRAISEAMELRYKELKVAMDVDHPTTDEMLRSFETDAYAGKPVADQNTS